MTDFLLDTNHASRLMDATSPLRKKLQQHRSDTFSLCAPLVAELWFMVYNSRRVEENRRDLQRLLSQLSELPFDPASTETFGRIKTKQRKAGFTVADVDLQIASIALRNSLTLLTADAAFANIPDLQYESWIEKP